jgi:hypothetical protein
VETVASDCTTDDINHAYECSAAHGVFILPMAVLVTPSIMMMYDLYWLICLVVKETDEIFSEF